jgi:hypothetical protein
LVVGWIGVVRWGTKRRGKLVFVIRVRSEDIGTFPSSPRDGFFQVKPANLEGGVHCSRI